MNVRLNLVVHKNYEIKVKRVDVCLILVQGNTHNDYLKALNIRPQW